MDEIKYTITKKDIGLHNLPGSHSDDYEIKEIKTIKPEDDRKVQLENDDKEGE